jgi:hypothetical protein
MKLNFFLWRLLTQFLLKFEVLVTGIFHPEWLMLIYFSCLGQILVGTLYLSLTYVNLIPASLAGLVVSRDLFLVYAGLHSHFFLL